MGIHIFSFEENSPSTDQQVARLHRSLAGMVFPNSNDIQKIADCLFVKGYDVSITLVGYKVIEVIISQTRSRYTIGSLLTLQVPNKDISLPIAQE